MTSSCKTCLNHQNHAFGLYLDEHGTCGSCASLQNADVSTPDLLELINKIKSSSKSSRFDCVYPARGTAEDYFVINTLLEHSVRPLVLFVNSYFNTNVAWYNFHNLITTFNLVSRTYNPDIRIYKQLVRYFLRKHEDVMLPYKLLSYTESKRLAHDTGTPYIISGEFQPCEQVGKFSVYEKVQNSIWSLLQHDLMIEDDDKIFLPSLDIHESALFTYLPNESVEDSSSWEYLSNYTKWDQWGQDKEMEQRFKARGVKCSGSFDTLYRTNSYVYYGIHDALRYKKFGYFKVRDHLSRETRLGRISLDQAEKIYNYKVRHPNIEVHDFLLWLGCSESSIPWLTRELQIDHLLGSRSEATPWQESDFKSWISTNCRDIERKLTVFEKGI
jgi:hypothetical protein